MFEASCLGIKGNHGFTLVEMLLVMAILAILTQMGLSGYLEYRRKAFDTTAMADARNLVEAVVNNIIAAESVDYSHPADSGNRIGAVTVGGDPRPPTAILSKGVRVYIGDACNSEVQDVGTGLIGTFLEAYFWHIGGTSGNLAPSTGNTDSIREYIVTVDEVNNIIEFNG
jgi:type IV pilus assembly protein PilA